MAEYAFRLSIHSYDGSGELSDATVTVVAESAVVTAVRGESICFIIDERDKYIELHAAAVIMAVDEDRSEDKMEAEVELDGFLKLAVSAIGGGTVVRIALGESEGLHVLLIPVTMEDEGVRLAPAVPRTPRERLIPTGVPFDVRLDAPSGPAMTRNRTSLNVTEKWICQPGGYSGDCWHIAAALLFDPSLRLVVPRLPLVPFELQISPVGIEHEALELLDYEVQLRSSLGVIQRFNSESERPWVYYHSGVVEVWIDVWARIETDEVVQFSSVTALAPISPVNEEPCQIQVPADHSLPFSDYLNYIDTVQPLSGKTAPVVVSLKYTCTAPTSPRGVVTIESYPENFVFENLSIHIRKVATSTVQELNQALCSLVDRRIAWAKHLKSRLRIWARAESSLEDALLGALEGPPRRLFAPNHDVTLAQRITSRLRGALEKLLMKEEVSLLGVEDIERFMSDEDVKGALSGAGATIASSLVELFKQSKETISKYVLKSNQFLDFYADCGIDQERILVLEIKPSPRQGIQAFSRCRELLAERLGADNPPCGMTFAATSVLMKAVESHPEGIQGVRDELRRAFTDNISGRKKVEIEEKLSVLKGARCILLNMRLGGYHPEHDVTPGIFRQIERFAKAHRLRLVCVGSVPESWKGDPEVERRVIDIYGDKDQTGLMPKEIDLRHTAYLWSCVADLENVVGVIGGMSGSLDIAAYMGVRTLCWDVALDEHEVAANLKDSAELQDRIRLLLSYPFMSICPRKIAGLVKGTEIDDGEARSSLSGLGLEVWYAGQDIVPLKSKAFLPERVRKLKDEVGPAFKAVLFDDLACVASLKA